MSTTNGLFQVRLPIEEKPQLGKDLQFLKRLCNGMLIMFRSNSEEPKISITKLLFAVALLSLDTYQAAYILTRAFENLVNDVIASATNIVWIGKCLVCLVFFVLWQFGSFQSLFLPQLWSDVSESRLKETSWDRLQRFALNFAFLFIGAFILVMSVRFFMFFYLPGVFPSYLLGRTVYDGLEQQTGVLAIFLTDHMVVVWLFIHFFYNTILSKVNRKVRAFNEDIKQIGSKSKNVEELYSELTSCFARLSRLTTLIRETNSAFEIYALIMVASNIVIMVLTLIIFVQYVMKSGNIIIFTVSTIGVWGFDLAALTIMPAKLHASIGQIEAEMFANTRIWLPANEKIYLIANGMVAHSKQNGLGISLYGFALMTKPMILTTSSIIVSYILLVGQISSTNSTDTSLALHN